jgi:hypothetical protein
MRPAKKQISELRAAELCLLQMAKQAKQEWPKIYRHLRESIENGSVDDEEYAILDLMLAGVALELHVLRNLFPEEQAKRIRKLMFKLFSKFTPPGPGEYVTQAEVELYIKAEVERYEELLVEDKPSLSLTRAGDILQWGAVSRRLLHAWLGEKTRRLEVSFGEKKYGVPDPVAILEVTELLMPLVGRWKKVKENYELVNDDLPFDSTSSYGKRLN